MSTSNDASSDDTLPYNPGNGSAGESGIFPSLPGYQLLGTIGGSGTGVIYRARDLSIGRDVAIKVLSPPFAYPDTCRRFAEAARIMGQLQHPGVPPVHAIGTLSDGRPFTVMKLVEGRSLSQILARELISSTDRPRFVAVFEQVCQTIAYAHARGAVYRNLKPQHVMIGAFGEAQVVGWGLAKLFANPEPAPSVVGTPLYMPPEQARGEPADCRSDVFGLGALLCHILTGRPPYTVATEFQVLQKPAAGDTSDALARLDACGADSELVKLCKRCLSPSRADRPADGGVVACAITAYRAAAKRPPP